MPNGIQWRQLGGVVLIGVVVATAGIVLNLVLGVTNIWPQVLLTVGSTFALGGVLFVLQRSWVAEVGEEARIVVQAVEERTAELEHEFAARRPISLEELQDLVAESTQAMAEDRRNAIDVLRRDISFENLSSVLALAQGLNAVGVGFRARATGIRDGLRLAAWHSDTDDRGATVEPYLELRVVPLGPATPGEAVVWERSDSLQNVVERLIASCERANLPSRTPHFDAGFGFRNLITSIQTAISIRQGASGPRLDGSVVEFVDERWTLTTSGLEDRFRDLLISLDLFVSYVASALRPGNPPQRVVRDPARPEEVSEDVSEDVWDYLKTVVWADLPDDPPSGFRIISL
jgi:hypothetical protein